MDLLFFLDEYKDYLYRKLQLALQTIVSTQTLDELLLDKNLLNQQVYDIVAKKSQNYRSTLQTVGARIILPGNMKAMLMLVVEAEKMAKAHLIKRRDVTLATRSLLNTVKVMEGNTVLLRLKN